jgi:hypothetical protein
MPSPCEFDKGYQWQRVAESIEPAAAGIVRRRSNGFLNIA